MKIKFSKLLGDRGQSVKPKVDEIWPDSLIDSILKQTGEQLVPCISHYAQMFLQPFLLLC